MPLCNWLGGDKSEHRYGAEPQLLAGLIIPLREALSHWRRRNLEYILPHPSPKMLTEKNPKQPFSCPA